jgi:hypothetical protein
MTALIIAAAAIVPAGVYVRWASRPVLGAYRAGRAVGHRQARSRGN